ncbi:MAG: hypothetical protein MAG471_01883 [Acidimicrobiaceae bacterium]|nr:hypothetical protein [Acidimicrobiaceae bacterium]
MRSASQGSQMSPLPNTGIEVTAAFRAATDDQSASPE